MTATNGNGLLVVDMLLSDSPAIFSLAVSEVRRPRLYQIQGTIRMRQSTHVCSWVFEGLLLGSYCLDLGILNYTHLTYTYIWLLPTHAF